MRNQGAGLAKLTRPRLHRPLARPRLFELVTQARERPLVWVSGPPGAGKTTLIATYLEELGLRHLWYQVDSDDADPATFFYYLREALHRAIPEAATLPLLTPEYLNDVPGFCRRFLRSLFSHLQEGVLVLDNYQDLAAHEGLHDILAAGLQEVPHAANIIVLTRAGPLPAFSDALIRGALAAVEWKDLQLTQDETLSLAAANGVKELSRIQQVHERTDGWMAGAKLMLERIGKDGDLEPALTPKALGPVFDYFSHVILEQHAPTARRLLLELSYLPRVTSEFAYALTGTEDAWTHLDSLHRRHLFVDRVAADPPCYQFHALFREFLKLRSVADLTQSERDAIVARAGRLLSEEGEPEEAFPLLLQAGEWKAAEQLLLKVAPRLVAQGRWRTVKSCVEALPPVALDDNPWLRYWLGSALMAAEVTRACEMQAIAFSLFKHSGDVLGQALCAASILTGLYFELDDFSRMDPWLEALDQLLWEGIAFENVQTELFVQSAFLNGCALRRPSVRRLNKLFDRVRHLLEQESHAQSRVLAGTLFLASCTYCGQIELGRRAIRVLEPIAEAPEVTAINRVFWWFKVAFFSIINVETDRALAAADRAYSLAAASGLRYMLLNTRGMKAYALQTDGRTAESAIVVREMDLLLTGGTTMDRAQHAYVSCNQALLEGNSEEAVQHAILGSRAIAPIESPWFSVVWKIFGIGAAVSAGRMDLAETWLSEAEDLIDTHRMRWFVPFGLLARTYYLLRRGESAASHASLRQALASEEEDHLLYARWLVTAKDEVLAEGFRAKLNPELTVRLIRRYRVRPPDNRPEDWPWPFKIFTLGRFEVQRDGVALRFERKAPRRVLQVLKALIAHGGVSVPLARLADDLWSEEDGDAARQACNMTLYRLRKLLGRNDVISIEEGLVSLDGEQVWVDALEFEQRLDGGDASADVIEQYRGQFLPEEPDAPWTLISRDRLRAKYVRHVVKAGQMLELEGRFESATAWYERAIEMTELSEDLYQGLIRCYVARRQWGEAYASYERLRRVLAGTLGILPSPATEGLLPQAARIGSVK